MQLETTSIGTLQRQYGSERDVERLTGRKAKTLQKDRLFGRGFPFYRVGRTILYDLNEVREIIRSGRVDTEHRTRAIT